MSNIFLCSDHHMSHANLLSFKDSAGNPLRSFNDITEHDEYIIEQHNKVVRPSDKVYFLGDFTFSKNTVHLASRFNGDKVLIKGNHDTLALKDYLPYFRDIRGCHQFAGMFLSHVPIHPESLGRWSVNVHGHLHSNVVKCPDGQPDIRYQSVCMEMLDDYTPISLEQLKVRIKNIGLLV